MNKRIIALIMVVPFIFLYLMFSTSHAAAIQVNVPVSGVKITNQLDSKTKVFDLATYENDFYLEVQVLPTQAKNQNFSVNVLKADNESELAQITVDKKTGLVTPLSLGKARITVETFDGGFKDTIIAVVVTSKPLSLEIGLQDFKREGVELFETEEDYDYAATVRTGRYYAVPQLYPDLNDASVSFRSSDKTKAVVNSFVGFIDVVSSGSVIIFAEVNGAYGVITKSILLNATQAITPSGITINGSDGSRLLIEKSKTSMTCVVEARSDLTESPQLLGVDVQSLSDYSFVEIEDDEVSTHKYLLSMSFLPDVPPELNLAVAIGGAVCAFSVELGDFTFGLYEMPNYQIYGDAYVQHIRTTIDYYMLAEPDDGDVEYEWQCDRPELVDMVIFNEKCSITAKQAGKIRISVNAFKNGVRVGGNAETFDILFVENVSSAEFDINTSEWGIAGKRAFGNKIIASGVYKDTDNAGKLSITVFSGGIVIAANLSEFEFSSGNPDIATIKIVNDASTNFVQIPTLQIKSTGTVDILLKWKYSKSKLPIQSVAEIQCVKDGVNVGSYQELVKASEDGRKIVLENDIMLGKEGATLAELEAMTKILPTTYSSTYHDNLGRAKPTVRYCIEFKNDVFGNGYFINGEYITRAEDKTGIPLLFKGALNFAEVPGMVSVKGQDNIVFLVRTDGVVLDNLLLQGCSDSSIMTSNSGGAEGLLDLSKLHRGGTVLEIMSNASIINSRIKNGKNTVRAYGGNKLSQNAVITSISMVDAARERIVVEIESCIISQAREFLVKIGANCVLLGTKANNAPNLQINGKDVLHTTPGLANNADFYNQLVLTDVTVRNCVLATSGLFAIGIDSNYAGPALLNDLQGELAGLNNMFDGWDNLGGTSFASILRLEGEVRIYDWKDISSMDSSTIVETAGAASEILNIDLDAIMNKGASVRDGEFEEIIYEEDSKKYINTSIFMFGGGKNYSQVVFDDFGGEIIPYYPINANILTEEESEGSILYRQGQIIPLVIGKEDFQFYMYNKYSENNYQKQVYDMLNGEAYNWVTPASL